LLVVRSGRQTPGLADARFRHERRGEPGVRERTVAVPELYGEQHLRIGGGSTVNVMQMGCARPGAGPGAAELVVSCA
jgi:hypothetical protein